MNHALCNPTGFIAMAAKLYFIYLRTRLDVEFDEATDYAAWLFGDRPELIAPSGEYDTFANGFVARRWAESADALAKEWGSDLAKFEAWAIHDGFDDVVESIGQGPVETALRAARSKLSPSIPVTQAFVIFHPAEQEPSTWFDPDSATEMAKRHWQYPVHSAFHFRNGRVLFVASQEAPRLMARRMEDRVRRFERPGRGLRKDVHEIALYDSGDNAGIAYFAEGPAWKNAEIYEDEPEPDPFVSEQ
jgi:hypothetical protein